MIQNDILELNKDCALLWGINEYETKEVQKEEKEKDEYLLIDNPINRIKDMKY